ncbi:MAG: hypothetical protein ACR2KK_18875 [Acidimicrobiales bacterium]
MSVPPVARQLRAELRKLVHPLTGLAVAAACAICVGLQLSNADTPYPGPSLVDVTGAVRIAALQFGTTIGFCLAALFAAVGTASDLWAGTVAQALLSEPRRLRLAALKIAALAVTLMAAMATLALTLAVSGFVARRFGGVNFPSQATTSVGAAATETAAALLIVVFAATISVLVAFGVRSPLATAVVPIALYLVPYPLTRAAVGWALPTRWTIELLHLDPFGRGVDYLVVLNSPFDRRGAPALVAGALLVVTTLVAVANAGRVLNWASVHPTNA